MPYAELHAHSNFSFLEGASHIEEMVLRARELGYEALALTDHDGLHGAMEFAQCARAWGLKPITGAEVTLASSHHLTLLCETQRGYANLCRLLTHAHLDHERGKPCIEPAVLARHAEGLIALSGCRRGEVPSLVAQGRYGEAEEAARRYLRLFGPGNFFVELQNNLAYGDARRNRALADQGAAFMAVAGTLAALYRREKTGLGERVETSLLESTIYQLAYEIALYTICGVVLKNIGSSHIAALPYGIYRTSDGWVAIAAPFKFDALCIALDRLDLAQDERFDSPGKIVKNRDVLEPELEAAFKQRSTAEWLRRLEEADVPCSPVNDIAQAIREPQVEATEMIVSVPHARGGDMRLVGSPIRFASSSAEMRQRYLPPPLLGQHTDEILTQVLGRQPQEIAELREAGVIG